MSTMGEGPSQGISPGVLQDDAGPGPLVQNLRNVHFTNGNLNIAGRDIHYHYHGSEVMVNTPSVLKTVPNFRKIHIATLGKATVGTGLWIYEWGAFCLWLDPEGWLKIMWGSGMPGAGKTVLGSILINATEAHAASSPSPICVAYLYIRYSDNANATIQGFLEVLVKQTVERHSHCLPVFNEIYARHICEESRPKEEELLNLLQRFSKMMSATFYFIDALDEAPTDIQLDLIEKLTSLDVKLFIISRPLKALEAHFPDAHTFSIVAHERDLDLHIAKEVARSVELRAILKQKDSPWQEIIATSIKHKCSGMFLHASLQLNALRHCTSLYHVEKTLENFPPRIEDVYHRTWSRILNQTPEKASLARRVLLPSRLVDEKILVGLCCGLVAVEENSRLVRLIHSTAKGVLEPLILETIHHPHSTLSAVCIAHLTRCGFQNADLDSLDSLDQALQSDPLLAYAHDAWPIHAKESLNVVSSAKLVAEFVSGCHAFPVYPIRSSGWVDVLQPLHIVARFDLPVSLAGSNNMRNPNVQTRITRATALGLAALHNSKRAVKELLSLPGILVNVSDHKEWTPLMRAAAYDRQEVAKFLLDISQLKVNQIDEDGRTALLWASGIGNEKVVEMLLVHPKIEPNLADEDGSTPLIWAAQNGHTATVKLLLAHSKIEPNLIDADGSTALIWGSQNGHFDVVESLLAHPQIDASRRDENGWTALRWAQREGFGGIADLILVHTSNATLG